MKPLGEQDYYEILEIPRRASPAAVERAYRLARSTFAEDSLALYSVVDPRDAEGIRDRVEEAYRVLSNAAAREEYDRHLAPAAPESTVEIQFDPEPRAEPRDSAVPLTDVEEPPEQYDGAAFRNARLRRSFDFEKVASLTKVNPRYLRYIEEENMAGLPARVYVRGFVEAFARAVGFDPGLAVQGFMSRYDEAVAPPAKPRKRFRKGSRMQLRKRGG